MTPNKKKVLIFFLCFALCSGLFLAIKGIIDCKRAPGHTDSAYTIPKKIQFSFTLQNKTNRVIKKAEFWAYAPVKRTATQRCLRIESSHPHELITDVTGNQVLYYTFDEFPPYSTRIITVKTDLMVSGRANLLAKTDLQPFLRPEKYIESDDPRLGRLARSLKAPTHLKTAEKIFQWVADNVQYAGYLRNDRGALYAFTHKKGDCTEFMHLFTALCRANDIPARCIGGYICRENSILRPGDYHNWAEFYHDGAWRISDPQNRVFMKDRSSYIAMRLITESTDNSLMQFNRFLAKGPDLKVKMNS